MEIDPTDMELQRRSDVRTVRLATFAAFAGVSTLAILLAAGSFAWSGARVIEAENRVDAYLVKMDGEGRTVGVERLDLDKTPDIGLWTGFAREWVLNLRRLSTDRGVNDASTAWVNLHTESNLGVVLNFALTERNARLGGVPVSIEDRRAWFSKEILPGKAELIVRWTEKPEASSHKPEEWEGRMVVVYQRPSSHKQLSEAPDGFVVVDFLPQPIRA